MRSRAALFVLLAFAVMVAVPSTALAQSDADIKALTDKVNALEQRIATMERNLTTQLKAISKQLASGGAASPAAEAEAQTALAAVNKLIAAGDSTKAKADMTAFMQKYGNTQAAKSARRTYQELQVVGKAIPADWGIEKWFQGESDINLAGANTTLVVFWETWCPHCQREVPKLQALYDSLRGDGLQVVGLTKINKSSTEEKVSDFIKAQNVNYPIAKENGSASTHFGVSGIPAAAVVKDGKVIWRGHPARLSEAQLKGWL
jgi:thiol-disulfide isomerase/thioredoxin